MLSDALADFVHHGLIFCQAMFSIQPLLSLDSWGRLVRIRGRKSWRYFCIFHQSPCSLRQQSMVRYECTDECLGQVVKQVPTIGDLHRLRRSCCCCLRIQAGAIATDNLRSRMSTKPFRSAFRTAVRQQMDDLPRSRSQRIVPYRCPLRHAESSIPNTRGLERKALSACGATDEGVSNRWPGCRVVSPAETLRIPRCARNLLERSAQPAGAP